MRYYLEAEVPIISSRAISTQTTGPGGYVRRGMADWQTLLQSAADDNKCDWKLYAPRISRTNTETAARHDGSPSTGHDESTPRSQSNISSRVEDAASIPPSPPSNRPSQQESIRSRTPQSSDRQATVSPNSGSSPRTGSPQPSARSDTSTEHTRLLSRPPHVPATMAQNADHPVNGSPRGVLRSTAHYPSAFQPGLRNSNASVAQLRGEGAPAIDRPLPDSNSRAVPSRTHQPNGTSGTVSLSAANGQRVLPENTSPPVPESSSKPIVQPVPTSDASASHATPANVQPATTSRRRRWYDPIVNVVNYVVNR
ncbi:hypothetical protein DENSPDRAFT_510152 [Dentipellis sp. KUC8613]|nr:hypothetical protein DENSPDRAFT_510152 [Dentipellis sp. KUC8613]